MIFEEIRLFFAPLPFVFSVYSFVATMSGTGDVIPENLEENLETCSLDPGAEKPPNYKTKIFRIGDGNIIGKSIIQEFFDCTGVLHINKRSILLDKNCYADAIAMLIDTLERKCAHPSRFAKGVL